MICCARPTRGIMKLEMFESVEKIPAAKQNVLYCTRDLPQSGDVTL